MGQDCCSQRNHEQSSIGLMNGVSYRKSIQGIKQRTSHIYDEEIIENIKYNEINNQKDSKEEYIDSLTRTPLFQFANSDINPPIIEELVIEQDKAVDNKYISRIREGYWSLIDKDFENKRDSVENNYQANIKEVKVEQPAIPSQQIDNEIIDQRLQQNKLEPEQLSFSTNFNTIAQSSQSQIEKCLKNKQTPGKLSSIFLRALERKILGISVVQEQKEEKQVITILDRPVPKVRPRKIQKLNEF